jgi:hypothetical protein
VIRAARTFALLGVALALAACAGPPAKVRAPLFARVDAERAGPEIARLEDAPAIAEADALRKAAIARDEAGDPVGAELLLEQARAKLVLAVATGRSRDAEARTKGGREGAANATKEREAVVATEAAEQKAIDDAVAQLAAVRAKQKAAALEPVSGSRDKARRMAAESTLLDASETCAFARALGVKGAPLDRAAASMRAAERRVGTGTDLLEAAARARQACLTLHAPETARQAERRVTTLDKGLELASSMGLEATRDAIGLTFAIDGTPGELDALASFVRAYGGVALVVDRRSDPGHPIDLQSTAIAKALGNAEGVLQLAPRVALGEEPRRRLSVRVAPKWPAEEPESPSAAAEP